MFVRSILSFILALTIGISALAPVVWAEVGHRHETSAAKYRCPMHPQVVSDKPGECPICHMRLVPIEKADLTTDHNGLSLEGRVPVKIDDSSRISVGIRTQSVEKMVLNQPVSAWGRVAHDPELYQLEVDFLREERLNYERERDRTPIAQKRPLTPREKIAIQFLDMGLSPEWIKALEDSGVPDKRLIFHTEQGIWIFLQLKEADSALVKAGDKVKLSIAASPEKTVEGHVKFIDRMVSEETRTVRAHVLIENSAFELTPNMLLSASVAVQPSEELAVPQDAVLFTGSRAFVFIDDQGMFVPREVNVGRRIGGFFEIKNGLAEGEKIAASGSFFIDSESRLKSSVQDAAKHEGQGR